MASAGEIRATGAVVEVGGDLSPLQRALRAGGRVVKDFGADIMKVGAATTAAGLALVGPLLGAFYAYTEMGSQLVDMSDRTGVAVEALQGLGYAAEQSGSSMADVETGLKKMSTLLVNARGGSREAAEALARLGLSVQDFDGLSPDQAMMKFADAIGNVDDPMERSAAAVAIFGRSGTKLLPMMKDGAAGIDTLIERHKRLNRTISTEDAQAAEQMGDLLSDLKQGFMSLVFQIGAGVAPVLKQFLNQAIEVIGAVTGWVNQNRELIGWIFRVGVVITGVGVGITILGGIVYAAGYAMIFLSGVVGTLWAGLSLFFSLASGGFGLLTLLSWGWGLATFAAGAIASAAIFAYNVGLTTLTVISWLWNAAGVAMAFTLGLFTGASAIASIGTWGYTAALVAAWIWENLCTVGIVLLITVLGLLVIAIGIVVAAFAGFIIFALAVAFLPMAIRALTAAFTELWGAIGNSEWFQNLSSMFGAVADTAKQAFGAIKAAFNAGEWGLMWDILKVSSLLVWEHISNYVMGVVYHWKDFIIDTFNEVWTSVKLAANAVWTAIAANFLRIVGTALTAMARAIPNEGPLAALRGQMTDAAIAVSNQLNTVEAGGAEREATIRAEGAQAGIREQELRAARDQARAQGNLERVSELQSELNDLEAYAQFLEDASGGAAAARRRPPTPDMPDPNAISMTAMGSFSAAAVSGFRGAGPVDRMANGIDRLVEINADIRDRMRGEGEVIAGV